MDLNRKPNDKNIKDKANILDKKYEYIFIGICIPTIIKNTIQQDNEFLKIKILEKKYIENDMNKNRKTGIYLTINSESTFNTVCIQYIIKNIIGRVPSQTLKILFTSDLIISKAVIYLIASTPIRRLVGFTLIEYTNKIDKILNMNDKNKICLLNLDNIVSPSTFPSFFVSLIIKYLDKIGLIIQLNKKEITNNGETYPEI